MRTIEPVVEKWYRCLDEGKIMIARCKSCGAYEFPPVPICNECGHHEFEWQEISGEGTLVAANDGGNIPVFAPEFGVIATGEVALDEGPTFIAPIVGADTKEERAALFDKVPCKVKVEIQQRDGYKYPCFRVER